MPMSEGNSALRLNDIQEQIGRGEYRVDTQAVAEAIIRRLLQEYKAGATHKRAQGECS
jgi:anti-sigma28 factor (negative regulator of flagellin synthesis)